MENQTLPPARGKIDKDKLKEALSNGMNYSEAARFAGSKAKTRAALAGVTSRTLDNDPQLREDALDIFKQKRLMALDAMSQKKFDKASAAQLATFVGIMTDKINLLEGKPTQRIAADIDVNTMSDEELQNTMARMLGTK